MKKRKKYNLSSLISLYISFIFQRTTIFVFSISLFFITLFLVIVSNPWLKNDEYLLYPEAIHNSYLTFGLFIIQIFNSIIIATIVISLTISSSQFDSLFISYTPRSAICTAKLLALTLIIFFLSIFEIFILYFISLLIYSNYTISVENLMVILFLVLTELIEGLFSICLTTLLPSIITPLVIIFIFIVEKLLCNNFAKINQIISNILPIINVKNNSFICDSFIIGFVWLALFLLMYITIYNIKDL